MVQTWSLKDLVCCTDNFVRALGGKWHYCPHSLLGINNLRSRMHNRENAVQIMRNTTSTYLCTKVTFKQCRSCERAFRSREKKIVSFKYLLSLRFSVMAVKSEPTWHQTVEKSRAAVAAILCVSLRYATYKEWIGCTRLHCRKMTVILPHGEDWTEGCV